MNTIVRISFFMVLLPLSGFSQSVDWFGITSPPAELSLNLQSASRDIAVNQFGEVYTVGYLFNENGGNALTNFSTGTGDDFEITATQSESAGFLMKQDSGGEVIWLRKWDNLSGIESIAITSSGEIVLGGVFQSTVDFDPNIDIVEVVHQNTTIPAAFVMKLNALGELIWVKDFQGNAGNANNRIVFTSLALDESDQILVCGNFSGSVNLGELETSYLSNDGFVMKLDENGNLIWNKIFYGINAYYDVSPQDICADQAGNIVVTGSFKGFVRFNGLDGNALYSSDGSGPQASPFPNPNQDIFVLKLDAIGEYQWCRAMGQSQSQNQGLSVKSDKQGQIYTTGSFRGVADFQGAGFMLGSADDWMLNYPERIYLCKQASDGNVQWVHEFGKGEGSSLDIDNSDNPCFSGQFTDTADFDPGIGTNHLVSNGSYDAFVARVDNAGNLIWAEAFGGITEDHASGVNVHNYAVHSAGQIHLENIGLEGTNMSLFNVKFEAEGECSVFNAIITEAQHVTCVENGTATAVAIGGLEPYNYEWNTQPTQIGPSAEIVSAGYYTVTATDDNGCERSRTVLLSGPPMQSVNEADLSVNMVFNFNMTPGDIIGGNGICGNEGVLWIDALNASCITRNATISLTFGDFIYFTESNPSPNAVSGNTYSWDVNEFNFDSGHFIPVVSFTIADFTPPFTGSCIDVEINSPQGDINAYNNHKTACFQLLCSYDPNDKMVYPQGVGPEGFVEANETMTYTVRFQNTGTAPAINVFIIDTIDTNLDISSLRVVGNSHDLITELEPDNTIRFRFDNINLPDSGSNQLGSNGYVIYEIDQLADLTPGTQFQNSASIYFDYNEPVITNSALNTISLPVGIADMTGQIEFELFPVPTSDFIRMRSNQIMGNITFFDALGRTFKRIKPNSNECGLSCSDWPSGFYLAEVIFDNQKLYKKLIIQN